MAEKIELSFGGVKYSFEATKEEVEIAIGNLQFYYNKMHPLTRDGVLVRHVFLEFAKQQGRPQLGNRCFQGLIAALNRVNGTELPEHTFELPVAAVVRLTERDLLKTYNFHRRSLGLLREYLATHSLRLGMEAE